MVIGNGFMKFANPGTCVTCGWYDTSESQAILVAKDHQC